MLFFLFRVVFNILFTVPLVVDNAKLKLTLTVPTGAPIKVVNYAIDISPINADKTIKGLSK